MSGLNTELTAIYFIWKRELIRFFRSKSRIIGSMAMPLFFLAIIGTGLNSSMNLPMMQGNYVQFITPGILGMVLMMGSLFSGIIIIMDRQFGFLKETMVAPVSRTSIVIGKCLGGATTALIQALIMLGISMLLGVHVDLTLIIPMILLMLLISWSFVALGIAFASVMEDMHGFQLIMNFLIMPLFFLSGALFPLDKVPAIIRYVSYADPLTYGVDALRYILLDYSTIPIGTSIAVMVGFFVVCNAFAIYLFSKIES